VIRAALLAVLVLAHGCGFALVRPDGTGFTLSPGLVAQKDTIQTIDFTIVGIEIDVTREAMTVGYKAGRITSVPVSCRTKDGRVGVPSLKSTKSVESSFSGGTRITDTLNMGELE